MITDKAHMRLISNIIHRMYQITDDLEMRKTVLKLITMLVQCDQASFYLGYESEEKYLIDPVAYNMPEDVLAVYENKYMSDDYVRWMFKEPKNQVFRETDFFEESVRMETDYYINMYKPTNVHYSLNVCLYYSKIFLGVITLFRSKDKQDFSDDDVFLLDLLKDPLALRLFYSLKSKKGFFHCYGAEDTGLEGNEYNLTSREKQVLEMIFEGLDNDEISNKLFISPYTMKKHLMNIYKKVGVNSKFELLKKMQNL